MVGATKITKVFLGSFFVSVPFVANDFVAFVAERLACFVAHDG